MKHFYSSSSIHLNISLVICVLLILVSSVNAISTVMNYQGKIESGGEPFNGTGQFRFALMNEAGTVYHWTNDGLTPPAEDVSLTVTNGLFHVKLGDTSIMDSINAHVYEEEPLYLRIWFDDGTNGSQLLIPDQEILSVAFSVRTQDALMLDGRVPAYYHDWDNLTDIPPEFADGTDDDSPDGDAEVPDDISINNGRLFAPAGTGRVGIGVVIPEEKLEVDGKIKSTGEVIYSPAGTGVYVEDAGTYGLRVDTAGTCGIQIEHSDGDGIMVSEAGSPSGAATSAWNCGVEVAAAEGHGYFAGQVDKDGFYVHLAGNPISTEASILSNGLEVAGAAGNGVFIGHADQVGIFVNSTLEDGVKVVQAGSPSNTFSDSSSCGLEVQGAEGHGVFVGRADQKGVNIKYTGAEGVYVELAGGDGYYVYSAGSIITETSSPLNNGFEVAGAEGHGLFVGIANESGVYVDYADDSGVYVDTSYIGVTIQNAVSDGVHIDSAGLDGIYLSSTGDDGIDMAYPDDYGLYIWSSGNDAVYANTSQWDGYGLYTPDRAYAGDGYYPTKSGTFALNKGQTSLEPGDLVCIAGGMTRVDLATDSLDVIHTALIDRSNSNAFLGVVEKKAWIREESDKTINGEPRITRTFRLTDGEIKPGDYLAVTIIGPALVKVEADEIIQAGESLKAGALGMARKVKVRQIEGIEIAENTGIIGKALENSNGSGYLRVFLK